MKTDDADGSLKTMKRGGNNEKFTGINKYIMSKHLKYI
jgi:hypothetical protein